MATEAKSSNSVNNHNHSNNKMLMMMKGSSSSGGIRDAKTKFDPSVIKNRVVTSSSTKQSIDSKNKISTTTSTNHVSKTQVLIISDRTRSEMATEAKSSNSVNKHNHSNNKTMMKGSSSSGGIRDAKTKFDPSVIKNRVVTSSSTKQSVDSTNHVSKTQAKGKSVMTSSKTTTTTKTQTTVRTRVKKVYSLPGQKFDVPEEREPLRIFYESLSKQIPSSEMAEFWMMEHGMLSPERAKKAYEKKQRRIKEIRMGTPIKSPPSRPESSKRPQQLSPQSRGESSKKPQLVPVQKNGDAKAKT